MEKIKKTAVPDEIINTAFFINEENLDEDWKNQAVIFAEFFKKYAHYARKRADLKRKMKVRHADLNMKIRKNPELYLKGVKPTESAFEAFVDLDKEYNDLHKLMIDAEYFVNLYDGAMSAMGDKRKALEYFGFREYARYHSEPSSKLFESKLKKVMNEENEKTPRRRGN